MKDKKLIFQCVNKNDRNVKNSLLSKLSSSIYVFIFKRKYSKGKGMKKQRWDRVHSGLTGGCCCWMSIFQIKKVMWNNLTNNTIKQHRLYSLCEMNGGLLFMLNNFLLKIDCEMKARNQKGQSWNPSKKLLGIYTVFYFATNHSYWSHCTVRWDSVLLDIAYFFLFYLCMMRILDCI